MKKTGKSLALLLVCLILASACMFCANLIQRDFGKVQIIDGEIPTDAGVMTYKLYKPDNATADAKAPAVLLLHGYQNDHETCAAYAIELSRRGAVVLCLDEYGHGLSTAGLLNRGFVNQRVSTNFGNEKEIQKIGSTERYRLMMNFSNLSFFDERYTRDEAGNEITDSSCGGSTAYGYLASLDYVDETRMAVSGHSMGTWSSWSVAADYCDSVNSKGESIAPKAVVLQCGELFRDSAYDSSKIRFNNVLLLQAKYDEFSYFRDYQLNVTDELLKTPLRYEFLGTTPEKAAWNTTYGNFADGTARRMELLNTNHRLTTHNRSGLAAALAWFDEALGLPKAVDYTSLNALNKEYLVLAAMLLILLSLFPLMDLLLATPLFASAAQTLPPKPSKKPGLIACLLTILLSGLSFPFMTQLGHALLPLPEKIFRMTVGNGFLSWYLLLILIMLITAGIAKARKTSKVTNERFSFGVFLLSLLLAAVLMLYMYGVNFAYYKLFDLDLRFIWPFFRPFNSIRIGQFFIYLPVYALFYYLNNTKIMRDMRTASAYKPGVSGFLMTWLRNFLLMAGGVILITLLEYIPFFMGIGPGADVLFGSTFGGPFMSILILFVPQVLFFSVLCTYCYRKTGRAYTGAFLAAMLACWIVTGGSSFL